MAPAPKPPAPRSGRKKAKDIDWEEKIFRLLAIVLFGFVLYFAGIVFLVLIAAQYFLYFVEDKLNSQLEVLSARVRNYICQILDYMRFSSDTMPFPFSPFPED